MSWKTTQDFAQRLRWLKAHHGWTIEEMAALCDTPASRLERYLAQRNTAEPKLGNIAELALGLGVSLNWLVLGKGPMTMPEYRS